VAPLAPLAPLTPPQDRGVREVLALEDVIGEIFNEASASNAS